MGGGGGGGGKKLNGINVRGARMIQGPGGCLYRILVERAPPLDPALHDYHHVKAVLVYVLHSC